MIAVRSVSHAYPSRDDAGTPALRDINLEVADGEFVAVVGPSGCGKTTLLNLICGLEQLQQGELLVQGRPPQLGQADVGYMLARDCLLPWKRTLKNAQLALEINGVDGQAAARLAREALSAVGLQDFEDAYPAQLSHGMRQRVALARVFAASPEVILLDEPFSALDAQNRVLVQDAFLDLWERRRATVLLITHDLTEAICLADRVAVMSARPGRLKSVHRIELPRPRSASELRGSPVFAEIYNAIWEDLRVEVTAANEQSLQGVTA